MSLLNITIAITGSITILAVICGTLWLFYDLIKTNIEEPSFTNFLILFLISCLFTFSACLTYLKWEQKHTEELQQYLDLKTKYEKKIK